MSDPAIEAAQRAWAGMFPLGPSWSAVTHDGNHDFFVAAAREMARSVQELHRPVHVVFSWTQGRILLDPCPCCGGKAGIHPCKVLESRLMPIGEFLKGITDLSVTVRRWPSD